MPSQSAVFWSVIEDRKDQEVLMAALAQPRLAKSPVDLHMTMDLHLTCPMRSTNLLQIKSKDMLGREEYPYK